MKFERISHNKVKVLVTFEDLESLGISLDTMTNDPRELQEVFWKLIKHVEYEVGFKAEHDSQLVIEVMPHAKEGILLYITKLSGDTASMPFRKPSGKCRLKTKYPNTKADSYIFVFTSFEDLCQLSKISTFDGIKSSLYWYNSKYYLTVNRGKMSALFSEYSSRLYNSPLKEAFLKEHGDLIARDNALTMIKDNF